jgi:hypothetical protein
MMYSMFWSGRKRRAESLKRQYHHYNALVPLLALSTVIKTGRVWIASLQSPDEPRRHDVVYMAPDSYPLEIHSARLNLTLLPQRWRPPIPTSFPQ